MRLRSRTNQALGVLSDDNHVDGLSRSSENLQRRGEDASRSAKVSGLDF